MENGAPTVNPAVRCKPWLGTFVEIGARDAAEQPSARAIDAGFAAIARIHELLSFHDPASDLSKLNAARGKPVRLHPLSVRVIRLSKAMTLASHHAFNCTVGGAMIREGLLPEHGGRPHALLGTAHDIEIDGCHARLRNGIAITLDGIAKGYAVDLAVAAMRHAGARCGWVNAGGDMRVFGPHAMPVHLRGADGTISPLGMLENGAVASSRTLASPESGFRGQIIPTSERPSAPELAVWTVLSRWSWKADALTKVAANTPAQRRRERISSLGGQLVELPS